MEINKSLRSYNTFGINSFSDYFLNISSTENLKKALLINSFENKFILGGGSNLLLTKNIKDLCLHINIKGKKIIKETSKSIYLEVNAGENWHELVLWCVENNYGGIENLAYIPGNIGAAPIQNIGAYGTELQDVFSSCMVMEKKTGEIEKFFSNDCEFDYRDSVFKNEYQNKFVITSLCLKLSKKAHEFNLEYEGILDEIGNKDINLKNIFNAVVKIRKSKLPDPKKIGNSGSFFKNPVITLNHFNLIKKKFVNIPCFKVSNKLVKIPAAWLIEKVGLKGIKKNEVGVHVSQPLVLVNYGNATGKEILELAYFVKNKIKKEFKIELEFEVNII